MVDTWRYSGGGQSSLGGALGPCEPVFPQPLARQNHLDTQTIAVQLLVYSVFSLGHTVKPVYCLLSSTMLTQKIARIIVTTHHMTTACGPNGEDLWAFVSALHLPAVAFTIARRPGMYPLRCS